MSTALKIHTDPAAAAEACGAEIFRILEDARRARGSAALAVSGGSTPRIMFEWMAKQSFDWSKVDFFWVDERCVPADDPQSNYRMTRESLLQHAGIPQTQIHRIRTELTPDEAAIAYTEDIEHSLRLKAGELPTFDVIQRGMGPDCHTASLFPGEPLIGNRTGIAAAVWAEKLKQHRVTLLPGVLEKARNTLCLVTGKDKSEALKTVLEGERDQHRFPAQIASDVMIWFLDAEAAARLDK